MNRRYFVRSSEFGADNLTAAETEDKPIYMFKYRKLKKGATAQDKLISAAARTRATNKSMKKFGEAVARLSKWGG